MNAVRRRPAGKLIKRLIAPPIAAALLTIAGLASAAEYVPDYLDADDPLKIDVDGSLDYPYVVPDRITFDGDVRGGYFNADVDQRDGTSDHSDDFTLRVRYGANFGFTDFARLKARVAAVCSDSSCDPDVDVSATPGNGTTIDDGDIVIDELYIDFFKRGRLDVALGRMQTRSVTRGGLFVSTLTRLTSPNVAVNWTDGLVARYLADNGWNSKAIVQYNDSDGSSTLARPPLDFDDDDSRVSLFYSLESLEPWGLFTQRGFDVTYMPSALLKDGTRAGSIDDYWTLVGRFAAQWPVNPAGPSMIVSGELGYAPETPSEQAVSTGTSSDTDGLAWHLEASWMDFLPGHSVGINYGHTDPGWLLSTSYRANEDAFTLRYHWRPAPRIQLEVQGRWREEQEQLVGALEKRETFDWRARLTWVLKTRAISP